MDRVDILLVEDNPGDIVLTRRALEQCHINPRLRVARDGEEALRLLRDPLFQPQLVILDLNMPRMPGYVVLERDRKSTRLNSSHPSISYAVFCLKKKTMN